MDEKQRPELRRRLAEDMAIDVADNGESGVCCGAGGGDLRQNPCTDESSISLDLSIGFSERSLQVTTKKNLHASDYTVKNQKKGKIEEEMKRVVEENRRLTAMLSSICSRHHALRAQLIDLMTNSPAPESQASFPPAAAPIRRRKSEGVNRIGAADYRGNYKEASSEERARSARVSKICVRADSMVMRDGYHWRKYGQKVIRDNPYPRAYFRCSFAPVCPVKKKVQRSSEDESVLVVTYEGEHNHVQPAPADHHHAHGLRSYC
ncbi:putative WRKY transcription factor 40 [Apostasia shenzhenica]|uniref:Putative WRKY transcription factor 40 n=1 Tax=Apostasia shenzhenica TaxID=1088818 RepID=A0A2I0B7Z1_9ASPA|nr:putative WRKY transcription factor 40 [Apostasia shenzhenica]